VTIPDILALDFDGVLCDGMREYFEASRRTYALTWPDGPAPDEETFPAFRTLRPVILSGWEMPLLLRAIVERRQIHQVKQQARALQVAQELMAEPGAFGRALDQSGDVGDHEAAIVVHAYHAQIRVQRCERIVGDLGTRGRNRADKSGLACVGQTQQPDVGEHLEFELEGSVFARLSRRALARRAVGARLESLVAPAAFAAPSH